LYGFRKGFLVIIKNVKKKKLFTAPMKIYSERIFIYFAKLSGNTQICKWAG